jgi:hypothetical protein
MNGSDLPSKPVQQRIPKRLVSFNSVVCTPVAECALIAIAIAATVIAICARIVTTFRRQSINARLSRQTVRHKSFIEFTPSPTGATTNECPPIETISLR